MKSKIFRSDDAEYQKFYADMAAMATAPGLIELEEEDLAPFKEFTGSVYMGEAEAAGKHAAEIATKEAVSKAENFASAKEVLLHMAGSSDNVDMSVASGASSVLYEIAPDAELCLGVRLDDTLGKTVRVMVVAKIP